MQSNMIIISCIIWCCSTFSLLAQDNIVQKDGSEIKAKVIEIGVEAVKYKKFESLNGPIYSIPKYQIFVIEYENGTRDVFNETAPSPQKNATPTPKIVSLIPDSLRIRNYTFAHFGLKSSLEQTRRYYNGNWSYYTNVTFDLGFNFEIGNVFYFKIPSIGKKISLGANITWVSVSGLIGHPFSKLMPYSGDLGPQVTLKLGKNSLLDVYAKGGVSLYLVHNEYLPFFMGEFGLSFRFKHFSVGMNGTFIPSLSASVQVVDQYGNQSDNNMAYTGYKLSHFRFVIGMNIQAK